MSITFELPAEVEARLRAETPNLDVEVKESMLVELFRQDTLAHYELSLALGLDRFETDGVLKKHNVTEDLPSDMENEAALARLGVPNEK